MAWEEFRLWSAEEQDNHLRAALAVEHLHTTAPVVFRHSADEARGVGRPRLLPEPLNPGHQAALAEFRKRERAPAQKSDPANFSNFLADLERHAPGVEWEEFRLWPEAEQNSYLRYALAEGYLDRSVPATVRRAADAEPRPSKLLKPNHEDALKEFRERQREPGQEKDPTHFASFLRDLEHHAPEVEWDEFKCWPEEEQADYLRTARNEGRLHANVPAAVRRAAGEQGSYPRAAHYEVRRQQLLKPGHQAALEKFRNHERARAQKTDPTHFSNFLSDLAHHAPEVEWEEFTHWPAEAQVDYLRTAVHKGHLHKNVPAAVRRAVHHEIETGGALGGPAKQESGTDRAWAGVLVEQELDQARTAFIPELPHCDLTTGKPIWSLDSSGATVVRHAMEPMEENNDKFPLRDSVDPLGRAYARYAGEDGRCHPNVRLRGIDLASGYKTHFTNLCMEKLGLTRHEAKTVRDRLLSNAQREFERLIRNEPAASRPCETRKLSLDELPPHESVLDGQYGLFLTPTDSPEDQPTLRNGRILGFYMGVFAANDAEIDAIEAQHPDYERYAMETIRGHGKLTVYSAQGCANDLAFANTALHADAPTPEYDWARLNAEFIPFEVQLTDKEGKPTRETVMAMVALDNAIGNEIRVGYGPHFLKQFMRHDDRALSQNLRLPVKMEVDE